MQVIASVPEGKLLRQKIISMTDVIRGSMFQQPSCRSVLLPLILQQIKPILLDMVELEKCAELLSEMLIELYKENSVCYAQSDDLAIIVLHILRPIMQTVVNLHMQGKDPSILVSL